MVGVIMLNVIIMNVIMLSVAMLSVVAPIFFYLYGFNMDAKSNKSTLRLS